MIRACLGAALVVVVFVEPGLAQKKSGAVLPGGNSKQPIHIEAAKLDYFDKEQKLIYTGSVVATQGDSKLKASILTIFLAPKATGEGAGGSSTNQIQRMVANGPVTMIQRDQTGTGDAGTYDKGTDLVVLTGNVVLSQGPNVTKGDKLVYDLKSGHATVSGGRVVGMFQPGSGEASTAGAEPEAPRRRKAGSRGM